MSTDVVLNLCTTYTINPLVAFASPFLSLCVCPFHSCSLSLRLSFFLHCSLRCHFELNSKDYGLLTSNCHTAKKRKIQQNKPNRAPLAADFFLSLLIRSQKPINISLFSFSRIVILLFMYIFECSEHANSCSIIAYLSLRSQTFSLLFFLLLRYGIFYSKLLKCYNEHIIAAMLLGVLVCSPTRTRIIITQILRI